MSVSKKPLTVRDLPTELFRNILDHLGCESEDTLAACTLVCKDWLDVSRQHLFSEIHVLRGADESFEDFAIFAETHPTHAAFVRILSLEARLFSIPYNPELMPTLTIDLFARIVRALPGIQVIRMRQIHLIPGAELASLSELRYHLDHFEYEKCFAEISVAFELASLFRFDHFDFSPLFADIPLDRIRTGPRKLETRSLCVPPDTPNPLVVFAALQQVTPPSMLKTFRWPYWNLSDPQLPVAKFLIDLGQNLVDVDLGPSEKDSHTALPHLPRLQIFRYHTGVTFLASPSEIHTQRKHFAAFCERFLPNLPDDLHELVLYAPWGTDDTSALLPPSENAMAMWGVDTPTLARIRFLRRLTLNVPSIPCDEKHAQAVAGACFPKANTLGILQVAVVAWEIECREYDIYHYLRDC